VIITGDLVEQDVDALVNAANHELVPGAGVTGAIHRRGGSMIQEECDAHRPAKVGDGAIAGAGEPHARYVIHAASMAPGRRTTVQSLKSSMDNAFLLAREHSVRTIAIPAVGAPRVSHG
jgi:O-acetyl-ADP-ribose deacetylase (regulator of RNase III)